MDQWKLPEIRIGKEIMTLVHNFMGRNSLTGPMVGVVVGISAKNNHKGGFS